jgi:putative oxygen-independent coproporphyrinogen III oxidase
VPSTLPDGEPAPGDGALPPQALEGADARPFGVYVHVPFCATRCGYCDFNTYTASELGGTSTRSYVEAALAELDLAAKVLGDAVRPASTVFFGGGTPTLLAPGELARLLAAVRDRFGLTEDVEVTTEANPESVDDASLAALRAAGFNRISVGMQSAREHVLATLDRTHTPGRVASVVAAARGAGFAHVSVDLIYGTPGETDDDWQASLDAAVALDVDHVSAYALVVEPGTRMAAQVSRGELTAPDDDVLATRYEMADRAFSAAGLNWYEVSNWAMDEAARSRHNLGYWTGADWWGIGPGAHSHVGGVRWWNVKHPAAYADRLGTGQSPAAAREVLDANAKSLEDVMLRLRLSEGLPLGALSDDGARAADEARAEGLLEPAALDDGRLVLTLRGRLLADAVVRRLV